MSFPRHPGQLPVYYNPKAGIVPWSYADSKQGPLFSFGDGLGYGRIQYRDFELLPKPLPEGTLSEGTLPVDDTPVLELHFRAENPGPAEETAVPMLFVTDLESDVTRRVRELKAFDKKAVPGRGKRGFLPDADGGGGWRCGTAAWSASFSGAASACAFRTAAEASMKRFGRCKKTA